MLVVFLEKKSRLVVFLERPEGYLDGHAHSGSSHPSVLPVVLCSPAGFHALHSLPDP